MKQIVPGVIRERERLPREFIEQARQEAEYAAQTPFGAIPEWPKAKAKLVDRIRRLDRLGMGRRAIARELGCSYKHVKQTLRNKVGTCLPDI
jgi:DNA invertase Pin-like site-specific DNA recombinase